MSIEREPKNPRDVERQQGLKRNAPRRFTVNETLHVYWLLWGDKTVASSRLDGYMIHRYMVQHGVSSTLLLAPSRIVPDVPWEAKRHWQLAKLTQSGIVVFQKLGGPLAEHLVAMLREAGAATVYVIGDLVPENNVPFLCDAVVCDSEVLAEYYRNRGSATVVYIREPAEFWCDRSEIGRRPPREQGLRICWHGIRDRWNDLVTIKEVLREPEFADMQLVTVSNRPEADVQWSVRNLRKTMKNCDVGIVPVQRGPEAEAKPSDRVVQFMAAGLPVIAGKIRSYEEVIVQGWTGYFAETKDEYRTALRALRSPEARRQIAMRAYDLVRKEYPLEVTGQRWLEFFSSLHSKKAGSQIRRSEVACHEPRLLNDLVIRARLQDGIEAVNRFRYNDAAKDFTIVFARLISDPLVFRSYLTPFFRIVSRAEHVLFRRLATLSPRAIGRRR